VRDRCVRNYPPDGSPEQDPLVIGLPPVQRVMAAQGDASFTPRKSDDAPHKHAASTSGNGAVSRDNVRNGSAEGPVNKWPDSNRLHRQCLLAYDHSRGHLESRSQRDLSRAFRARLLGRRSLEGLVVQSRFLTFEGNNPTRLARRSNSRRLPLLDVPPQRASVQLSENANADVEKGRPSRSRGQDCPLASMPLRTRRVPSAGINTVHTP
jgi:hypothetical protein